MGSSSTSEQRDDCPTLTSSQISPGCWGEPRGGPPPLKRRTHTYPRVLLNNSTSPGVGGWGGGGQTPPPSDPDFIGGE